MVKSTVRFPEPVVTEIESLVDDGVFESKSEFYRFASEYVLTKISDDYDPQTFDFESIKDEVIPEPEMIQTDEDTGSGVPFLESLVIVRKYALRGEFSDAEDFIDHHYDPAERDALMLEEVLAMYREKEQSQETETTAAEPTVLER
ncbi:MAG: transcriptional regulator [Halobacteriales archaeon]|nr:transcriptional regulator [Halobacteriales archaeon]